MLKSFSIIQSFFFFFSLLYTMLITIAETDAQKKMFL